MAKIKNKKNPPSIDKHLPSIAEGRVTLGNNLSFSYTMNKYTLVM
jgi:hypothetical protein